MNLQTFYKEQLLKSFLFEIFIKSFKENVRLDHEKWDIWKIFINFLNEISFVVRSKMKITSISSKKDFLKERKLLGFFSYELYAKNLKLLQKNFIQSKILH